MSNCMSLACLINEIELNESNSSQASMSRAQTLHE